MLKKSDQKDLKTRPKTHIGYLVGYKGNNLYRIWVPSKNNIITTRDITFDKESFFDPATEEELADSLTTWEVLREKAPTDLVKHLSTLNIEEPAEITDSEDKEIRLTIWVCPITEPTPDPHFEDKEVKEDIREVYLISDSQSPAHSDYGEDFNTVNGVHKEEAISSDYEHANEHMDSSDSDQDKPATENDKGSVNSG